MGIADTAARLLAEQGDEVLVSYKTGGDIDPATGQGTPGETVTLSGFGYPGSYGSSDLDGTNILSGDVRLTLQNLSERPQVGWTATVDGKTYRIMHVRAVRKSASDVISICQLRAE